MNIQYNYLHLPNSLTDVPHPARFENETELKCWLKTIHGNPMDNITQPRWDTHTGVLQCSNQTCFQRRAALSHLSLRVIYGYSKVSI